jgi:hypothetical protein
MYNDRRMINICVQLATETERLFCDISTYKNIGTLEDLQKAVGSCDSGDFLWRTKIR